MPGKLVIAATFSVRVGSRRVRFEISPAASHGGPEDAYRVRIDRRWHDLDGKPLFLRRPELAALLADYALGGISEPAPAPEIPCPSRVTVEGGGTASPAGLARGRPARRYLPMTGSGWWRYRMAEKSNFYP